MNFRIPIIVVACLCFLSECNGQNVVLISIDGFRPGFYLDEKWQCYNMKAIGKDGYASPFISSIFPSVTYPAHTTMVTGELPNRHGIYYNTPLELEKPLGKWNWFTDSIKVETIWQKAKGSGLRTAAILWPVTVGANIDYNIPEIWSTDSSHDRLLPMQEHTFPDGLWQEIETNKTGRLSSADLSGESLEFDRKIALMAGYVIMKYRPNLTLVHFANVDEFQHMYGIEHAQTFKAVKNIDSCIGILTRAINYAGLKDSTTIIITGDHGFTNIQKGFYPNVILQNAGLIAQQDGRNIWKAKFQATGGSAFLYVKDDYYVQIVRNLLKSQPDSVRSTYDILEKDTLNKLGVDSNAQLAIVMRDGIFVGNNVKGNIIGKAPQNGSHGFHPAISSMHTGFIISRCVENKPNTLLDIMPLLCALLNLKD